MYYQFSEKNICLIFAYNEHLKLLLCLKLGTFQSIHCQYVVQLLQIFVNNSARFLTIFILTFSNLPLYLNCF